MSGSAKEEIDDKTNRIASRKDDSPSFPIISSVEESSISLRLQEEEYLLSDFGNVNRILPEPFPRPVDLLDGCHKAPLISCISLVVWINTLIAHQLVDICF